LAAINRFKRDYLRERGLEESKFGALLEARNAARAAKNWAEADRIRNELDAMGIALFDKSDGTTDWTPKQ
jgi:cysteinyl-tRNA synthetase